MTVEIYSFDNAFRIVVFPELSNPRTQSLTSRFKAGFYVFFLSIDIKSPPKPMKSNADMFYF